MKKIQKLIVITLALFTMNIAANALEIIDVKNSYWASQEIIRAIQNNYIGIVDGNKFNPEGTMTRSEFVNALLKVVQRQNESVIQPSTFKDVDDTTPNERSIKLSEQIAMAFGYPDKTFKPAANIDHNETMSMVANITKADYVAADITNFEDYDEIPLWAKRAYIKNVANGIYVNHPDELKFTPSRDLTRAEAAVLFDKIAANLDKVKDSFKNAYGDNASDYSDFEDDGYDFNKATFLRDETLGLVDFATNDKVKLYDSKKIIEAGNILVATALTEVKTRKDLMASEYVFAAPNDVYTKEGTFLYPKGTEFYARVDKIGYSAWRSKPEKSRIVFHKYSMPSGETYDMAGVPFTKKEKVVYTNAKKAKKTSALAYYDGSQKQNLIDVAHQMAPLTEFDIKKAKTIYILITGDTVIPAGDYMNLRTEESVLDEEL